MFPPPLILTLPTPIVDAFATLAPIVITPLPPEPLRPIEIPVPAVKVIEPPLLMVPVVLPSVIEKLVIEPAPISDLTCAFVLYLRSPPSHTTIPVYVALSLPIEDTESVPVTSELFKNFIAIPVYFLSKVQNINVF